jgi:hypothetical protein
MPRIANLIPMDGDRLACILEPQDIVGDPGCVTLWTDGERRAEIAAHVKLERERCAMLAINYGGHDASEIADLILSSDSQ